MMIIQSDSLTALTRNITVCCCKIKINIFLLDTKVKIHDRDY